MNVSESNRAYCHHCKSDSAVVFDKTSESHETHTACDRCGRWWKGEPECSREVLSIVVKDRKEVNDWIEALGEAGVIVNASNVTSATITLERGSYPKVEVLYDARWNLISADIC